MSEIQNEINRIKESVENVYSVVEERGGEVPEKPNVSNLAAAVNSIPKGTEFVTDDTLNLSDDGVLSVAIPVKELSPFEWNALSEDKKNRGLYFVKTDPYVAGQVVTWAGYKWIVTNLGVESEQEIAVLLMQEAYEQTIWGYNSYTNTTDYDYSKSTIKQKAEAFEQSLPKEALESAVSTTYYGVTSKIYVPSSVPSIYAKCSVDGESVDWWLSSTRYTSGAYFVQYITADGLTSYTNGWLNLASRTYFRPAVRVKQLEKTLTIYLNGKELPMQSAPTIDSIPVVPVTQEDYDALTEEEKMADILYLLVDADSGNSNGGGVT